MASRKSARAKPGSKKSKENLDRRVGTRDWEALLGLSAQALAAVLASGPEDEALDRAQELIFDAWEARSKKKRITLARQALAISPNCADAYLLLAEYVGNDPNEALDLCKRAVEAGEKALGKEVFEEEVGHFWGLLATRPYMRARLALAQALWDRGRHDEAITHLQDMLRLNPRDNQGVRYLLVGYLFEADRAADVAVLLKKYKADSSAWWVYSHALLAFQTSGSGSAASRHFARAVAANPHVPAYLLVTKKMPPRLPEFYSPGAEDEAICYVSKGACAWQKTDGALDWLRQQLSGR